MAHELNQQPEYIAFGPGYLWLNLAVPESGARLTLAADGTPDADENPNAINAGLTKAGARLVLRTTQERSEADQLKDAERTIISANAASIEGEFLQVLDFDLLEQITNATRFSGSGYDGITFGGDVAATPTCAALIWAQIEDPTKFVVWMLYQCVNEAGVEFAVTRKEQSAVSYRLVGQRVITRADQFGQFWRQT